MRARTRIIPPRRGSASLAGSDIIYSTSGRVRKIYLLESLAEIGLIGLWLGSWKIERARGGASMLQFTREHETADPV